MLRVPSSHWRFPVMPSEGQKGPIKTSGRTDTGLHTKPHTTGLVGPTSPVPKRSPQQTTSPVLTHGSHRQLLLHNVTPMAGEAGGASLPHPAHSSTAHSRQKAGLEKSLRPPQKDRQGTPYTFSNGRGASWWTTRISWFFGSCTSLVQTFI